MALAQARTSKSLRGHSPQSGPASRLRRRLRRRRGRHLRCRSRVGQGAQVCLEFHKLLDGRLCWYRPHEAGRCRHRWRWRRVYLRQQHGQRVRGAIWSQRPERIGSDHPADRAGTSGLQLAADGLGNLYIADPSNARVVKLSNVGAYTSSNLGQAQTNLTTGFTAPSAVAVDSSNNLYVIDGVNLFELTGGSGTPTTLLNNLSGATGLAVDPSGAVYITSASGTIRIPYLSGALAPASETAVASAVTSTSSVALDRANNVYLVQRQAAVSPW